jgi:biotin transport system substrate-specific component
MTSRTLLLPSTDFRADTRARDLTLIVTGSLLLAISAQIRVQLPWTPVPVTLQTLVVGVLGLLLGARRGALAVLLYLAEGASGLPFFTNGVGGIGALTAVTGGYLLAMPFGAAVVGWLAQRGWDRSVAGTFLAMQAGSLLVMASGTLWLAHLLGSWPRAFTAGFAPFIVGDILKAAAVALLLPALWALKNRISSL